MSVLPVCPFCGVSFSGPHKCPEALAHLDLAAELVDKLEAGGLIARRALRRFVFGRHRDGLFELEMLAANLDHTRASFTALSGRTPPPPPLGMMEHRERRSELARRAAAELWKNPPASAAPQQDAKLALTEQRLLETTRHNEELLARVDALERRVFDHDAELAKRDRRIAELERGGEPIARPGHAVDQRAAKLSLVSDAEPVAPAAPRRPPARVPDEFQFIEEDPVLGNMKAKDAWEALCARLEKLGDDEALVRCGLGHSWVAQSVKAEHPGGTGRAINPDQLACREPGCQMPGAVLTMTKASIKTVRAIAALPDGHRLGRCARGHEWDCDDEHGLALRMPDGRPMCPSCLAGAGGQAIRAGAELAFVAAPFLETPAGEEPAS